MTMDRRDFLTASSALGAAAAATTGARAQPRRRTSWRRIAVEEAFWTPAVAEAQRALGLSSSRSLDFKTTRGTCDPRTPLYRGLTDFDERLRVMDRDGVAMHLLSLTTPGVQMFDPETGTAMAHISNDHLADVIARHPTRFAGLGCIAPQSPKEAVKEMERSIRQLNLSGFIINSHTDGEFLDAPKYWPILEAAEGLDRPIYLHPRSPPDSMLEPFDDYGFHNARWGFQAEISTHIMRMHAGKVFDRFPKLTIVIGHMGEGLFGNLWRIDHMSDAGRKRRTDPRSPDLTLSEVLKRNFYITTSGVEHAPLMRFVMDQFGVDRMMWAIDYPYEDSARATAFMNQVDIPDAHKAQLFHLNAERIFRLPTV